MNTKWIILAVVIIAVVLLFYFTGVDNISPKKEMPSPTPSMQADMEHAGHVHSLELPEVSQVQLAIKNIQEESFPDMKLVPGEKTKLAGTEYSLMATEFYTHWNFDGRPVNISYKELNPAIKIEVFEGDSLLYHQWAFKNVPFFGMGGMNHPGGMAKDLGFALVSYEGLKMPTPESKTGEME